MGELDEVGEVEEMEGKGGWGSGEGEEREDSGRVESREAWMGGGNGAVIGGCRRDQQRSIGGCMSDWGRERGIQHRSEDGEVEQEEEVEQGHRIAPDDEHR